MQPDTDLTTCSVFRNLEILNPAYSHKILFVNPLTANYVQYIGVFE